MSAVTSSSRHFTASGVVLDPDRRKVLLVQHRHNGTAQFPGGHVEEDEAPHVTVLRELHEETGVCGELHRTLPTNFIPGSITYPQPILLCERDAPAKPDRGQPAHRHIDLLYVVIADSAEPVTHQPEENDGAVWVPIADLYTVPSLRDDVPAQLAAALAVLGGPDWLAAARNLHGNPIPAADAWGMR